MAEFEWDPAKNDANLAKHGIDFPTAARVFDGPILRVAPDRESERRWLVIGAVSGREIVVVYTERAERIRIISARRARTNERREYRAIHPK